MNARDYTERLLDKLVGLPGLRKASRPPQSRFHAWQPSELKLYGRMMFAFCGMSEREIVRAWKRNGRTTIRMWLASEETSGARFPPPEFVEWLYHKAKAHCVQIGIELPEAA